MDQTHLNEDGFGTYANAMVLNQESFNHLLHEYHIWYKREGQTGWLPVKWPDSLKKETGTVQANIDPVKITFLQDSNKNVRLRFTLKDGFFKYNETEIPISGWSFCTEGEVGFEQTDKPTADEFRYYKPAFSKVKENYRKIFQFYINLQSQLLTGQIDYNKSELTEEQKKAFCDNVQHLIAEYIAGHEKFVLAYIGASVTDETLSNYELTLFYPVKMYFQVFSNGTTSEVRFPYMWLIKLSDWYGDIKVPLVAADNEGSYILGRESFFTFLMSYFSNSAFVNNYQTEYKDGKLVLINIEDWSQSFKISILNETTLLIECDYQFSQYFEMPDLSIEGKTYPNYIVYHAPRKYEISVSLNYESNIIETDSKDLSDRSKDKFIWKNEAGETPMSPTENVNLYNSVVNGDLTEGAVRDIAATCIQYHITYCDAIMSANRNAVKLGHVAYEQVMKLKEKFDLDLHLPISSETKFIELPEAELYSFERIHFDNEWNVRLNMKRKSTPGSD